MDKDIVKAFADKVFADMAGAMTAGMGYLGTKTGLFRSMAGKGPMHVDDVVRESGLTPRYVEEWLKGMTCAKYLEYDPVGETYRLPDEHAFLLASDDTDHFMGGLFSIVPVLLRVAPDVRHGFCAGRRCPLRRIRLGRHCRVRSDRSGPIRASAHQPTGSKCLPPVRARLETGAQVLDVGLRRPWCIAIARDFPQTRVVGLDPDGRSIRQAEAAAAEAGVSERITFRTATTDDIDPYLPFDLITAFDCIHDFAAPQRTLEQIRMLLKSDGTLFSGAKGGRSARGQYQFHRHHVLRLQSLSLHDAVAC